LFVAELIGNVTPENIDFIKASLAPMLAASIYREVLDEIVRQAEEIKRERVSLSFQPAEVMYEKETDKVFVTGRLKTQGPGSKPVETVRTYELTVDINDYRPLIRHIDAYSGQPRTLEVIRAQEKSS
jgi:conjugal transfer pilus assembly protein TraE